MYKCSSQWLVAVVYAVASRVAKFMANNIFENYVGSKEAEQVKKQAGKEATHNKWQTT